MTTGAPGRIPDGAIVVGASRGIGRRIAQELMGRGFSVAALARSTADLRDLEAEAAGGALSTWTCDVTDPGQLLDAVAAARRALPPLGVVVHCAAATGPVGPLWEADVEEITHTLSVNVLSAFVTARVALAEMVALGAGRVLMLSSGAARRPTRFRSMYGGSKAAVDHLVRSVGEELAGRAPGVGITGIYPGVVETDMQTELRHHAASAAAPDVREEMARLVAKAPHPVAPEAVATSVADLVDRDCATVNGRILALRNGAWEDV